MAATELILLVAGIIAIGVLAQLLADRLQIPTIIFYIAAGLLLGPVAPFLPGIETRVIDPASFGDALPAIVGLAVAIIVFEGAFHLKLQRIKEAPAAALRIVTVGAIIALVGTAIAVRFILGASWGLSLTIGALLTATGPTVVTPILHVVPVRDRVAAALETEGIVNDVSAAILAVVFFELINPVTHSDGLLQGFIERLGVGLLFGVIVAGTLYYLVRYVDLAPGDAPRNARLLVLAGALVRGGRDPAAVERDIVEGADELTDQETTFTPEMMPLGERWARGEKLQSILESVHNKTDLSGGLVGAFRRAKDLVGQLREVYSDDARRRREYANLIRNVSRDEVQVLD